MFILAGILFIMLIVSVCLLFSTGAYLINEENKKKEPKPVKLTFDWADPWDTHLTVARLLREDKRRKKNRRAKRVIIR